MSGEEEQSYPGGRSCEDDWNGHFARKLNQALDESGVYYERLVVEVSRRSGRVLTANELRGHLSKGDISAGLLLQIIDSLSDKRLSLKDFYDKEIVEEGEWNENTNRRG